jgi:hypothetical protein
MKVKKMSVLSLATLILAACQTNELALHEERHKQENEVQRIDAAKKELTGSDALTVARLFRTNETPTKSASPTEVKDVTPIYGDDDQCLMYVINYAGNGGYSIISATKKYTPVVAYADEGNFEAANLPPGVSEWMDETKDAITYTMESLPDSLNEYRRLWIPYEQSEILTTETRANDDVMPVLREAWEEWCGMGYTPYRFSECKNGDIIPKDMYDYARSYVKDYGNPNYDMDEFAFILVKYVSINNEVVGPLLTTKWGQKEDFNNLCVPYGAGAPAGCNAIAVAQVMRYHQYPSTYNWSAMDPTTATQASQILIRDVGIAVDTDYSSSGSSSSINNDLTALHNYNYSATKIDCNNGKVITELKAHRPVIREGFRDQIIIPFHGHTWVCDGYHYSNYAYEYTYAYVLPGLPIRYKIWNDGYTPAWRNEIAMTRIHNNWGHYGNYNGWTLNSSYMSSGYDYEHYRHDLINIRPK